MNNQEIIAKTAEWVKAKFASEGSGHDWWHILRVWNSAKEIVKEISKQEQIDGFVVELGALLHDIADHKFHDDELLGGKVSREWLTSLGVSTEIVEAVVHIVDNVSFKGGVGGNKMQSLEGKVVQDADRLDSMGAIGIARCFTYGGYKGNEIYNPDVNPREEMTKEEYKKSPPSINHFYEKLLKLKNLMNTAAGKKLAQHRHQVMEEFLANFYAEWDGKQ